MCRYLANLFFLFCTLTKQNTHDFLNTSILDALVSLLDAVLVRHIGLGPVYRGPGHCFFEKNFPPGLTKKCLYAYLKMRFISSCRGWARKNPHVHGVCGTVPVSFEEAGICFCGVKIAKMYFLSKNFGKNLTKYGTGALMR